MRFFFICLLVAVGLTLSPANAAVVGPHRLADGTVVAEDAEYSPPAPVTGHMPMFGRISSIKAGGTFEADIVVSSNGEVVDVSVKHHISPALDRNIARALRRMKFYPAKLNGAPVAAIVRTSYVIGLTEPP